LFPGESHSDFCRLIGISKRESKYSIAFKLSAKRESFPLLLAFKKTLNFSESLLNPSMATFLNENWHCFSTFAACIFLDIEQAIASSTSPRQITIFSDMLNFFKNASPFPASKFTKFTIVPLLFTCLASAAINVNTANNAEIADFIANESKKILQVPDTLNLNLNFQTAKDMHIRAGVLFFMGERIVSIKMDYNLDLPTQQFEGTIAADSAWNTGYCGVLECQMKPMPAQQRIDVLKYLVSRILTELKGKLRIVLAEQKPKDSAETPVADTANVSE